MKAALITELKAPLKVENVPEPRIGPDEVLVKVGACGVCYSDVKIWTGRSIAKPVLPHILGHEVAGTVAEFGKNVSDVKKGERVAVYLYDTCDQCPACMMGRENYCVNLKVLGFTRPGGYAEYVAVSSENVFKLPDGLDFAQAALLPDAVITPYHAIVDKAQVRFNETAMVVGMGGLGLSGLQILKLLGARVIAVSRTNGKLQLAKDLGADATINASSSDVPQEAKRLTDGYGVDYVFDCVVNAQTIDQDLRSLRKGGKAVLLAYDLQPTPIVTANIMASLASLHGTRNGTRQNLRDIIRLAAEGKIKSIVSNTYPLNEVNTALTMLLHGEVTGRVVLRP